MISAYLFNNDNCDVVISVYLFNNDNCDKCLLIFWWKHILNSVCSFHISDFYVPLENQKDEPGLVVCLFFFVLWLA